MTSPPCQGLLLPVTRHRSLMDQGLSCPEVSCLESFTCTRTNRVGRPPLASRYTRYRESMPGFDNSLKESPTFPLNCRIPDLLVQGAIEFTIQMLTITSRRKDKGTNEQTNGAPPARCCVPYMQACLLSSSGSEGQDSPKSNNATHPQSFTHKCNNILRYVHGYQHTPDVCQAFFFDNLAIFFLKRLVKGWWHEPGVVHMRGLVKYKINTFAHLLC